MRRVLVCLSWARYTPHFETELELIEDHLRAGDEVTVAVCDADLPACDRNPWHRPVRCHVCRGRREFGLRLLSGPVRQVRLLHLRDRDREELRGLPSAFRDVEQIRQLRIGDFDAGYAVLSSMISYLRNPDPLAAENIPALRRLLLSAVGTYRSVENHLDEGCYDRVYVFNGRFAITRAVLRAAVGRGVECFTHERGHDHRHYSLYRNTTVHDPNRMREAVEAAWAAESDDERRRAVGADFFEERARGVEQAWFSFVADQEEGRLPENWDRRARNVVFFISSEDEFAALGDEWRNLIYPSQTEGIRRLATALGDSNIRFHVRIHPNLRGVDNPQTRELGQLELPNVAKIPAGSPISSYALLREAWQIVTFGSTMGVEATFWRKPSILLNQAFYRGLGAAIEPADHEDAVAAIRSESRPAPLLGALKYGFYMKTYGIPYHHYEPEAVFRGRFRGRRVRPTLPRLLRAVLIRAIPGLNSLLAPVHRRRRERAVLRGRRRDGSSGE